VISTVFLFFLTSSRTARQVALNLDTDKDGMRPPHDYGQITMVILGRNAEDVNSELGGVHHLAGQGLQISF
jgi:hypothetical protein